MKKLNGLNGELDKWVKHQAKVIVRGEVPPPPTPPPDPPPIQLWQPAGPVVGGVVLWKPVDRVAACLLSAAPWWAHAPVEQRQPTNQAPPEPRKRKKVRHYRSATKMSKQGIHVTKIEEGDAGPWLSNQDYTSKTGVRVKMVNGEPMMHLDDILQSIRIEVAKEIENIHPMVKEAKAARTVMHELMDGVGKDMEDFRARTKVYLEDIRATRFAVVTETHSMTKELKDLRQFFLGSDYANEIGRLREFVDLCERLVRLKESGFLDRVADTMLNLAGT